MNEPLRAVIIGCAHSAGVALDELREAGRSLPDGVEWVEVPCGASVDDLLILKAFESGADRVLVLVCNDQACRSLDGNRWAEKHTNTARRLLEEIGIDHSALRIQHIAPNMAADLHTWVSALLEAPLPATAKEDTAP